MNRKQLQLDVCKALLDGNKKCHGFALSESEYAVTTDGYTCFVFYENERIFDITKIADFTGLKKLFEDDENDVEIKSTGKLYVSGSGDITEQFAGENLVLYARSDVARKFKGYIMFAKSPLERIIVKDGVGRLVGLFLPVRYEKDKI